MQQCGPCGGRGGGALLPLLLLLLLLPPGGCSRVMVGPAQQAQVDGGEPPTDNDMVGDNSLSGEGGESMWMCDLSLRNLDIIKAMEVSIQWDQFSMGNLMTSGTRLAWHGPTQRLPPNTMQY